MTFLTNDAVLFSSKDDAWRTPPHVFDYFNKIYKFNVDAACTTENALCSTHITKEQDALTQCWSDYGNRVFLNPPYSRKWIGQFMHKAKSSACVWMKKHRAKKNPDPLEYYLVGALVYARTDTSWWHDTVMNGASEVWLLRGRLHFNKSDGSGKSSAAPAPSVFVIWRTNDHLRNPEMPVYPPVFKSIDLRTPSPKQLKLF
tara:strand:- start:2646 stop:3248 length:603 start_codon:yes stop_codon:yes gene_type:complete